MARAQSSKQAHSFQSLIRNAESYALDFDDIRAICRDDVDIVEFSEMAQMTTYRDLFKNSNRIVVYFETSSSHSGHYVAMILHNNRVIEFCDSYGLHPAKVYQYAPYDMQVSGGDDFLMNLIQSAISDGYKFEWNNVRYQSDNTRVSTCGRWASLRCRFSDLSLLQFHNFMASSKRQFPNSDDLVTTMTLLFSDVSLLI